jgi:hypothetical protein
VNAKYLGLAIGCALGALATAASAGTTVGTFNSGNCYPFSCNDSGTSVGQSIDYFQMYSSSAFSTTTTFSQISFFADTDFAPALVLSGNYEIIFGTTTDPLGSTYPIGPLSNVETFFDGSLPAGSGAGIYSISGASYTYNPADGNLVMEVIATNQANVPNGDGNGFFEDDTTGTVMTRAYELIGQGGVNDNFGLVTEFGAVPEPAAWALMLAGIAGLGAALRGRRKALTAPA